jgi:hypothetical protein
MNPIAWWLDRAALAGLALGAAAMLQPWWSGGLKWGFFLALAATILHTVTSHLPGSNRP